MKLQFKTTGMLVLVMAGAVSWAEAQEIGGVGNSSVVPWVGTVDMAQGLAKTGSGQDARTSANAHT